MNFRLLGGSHQDWVSLLLFRSCALKTAAIKCIETILYLQIYIVQLVYLQH